MDLATRLHEDMKIALKGGDKQRLQVIRMLLSDVKIIDMAPKPITAEETVAIYAKKLRKSREEYVKLGRAAEVTQLDYEIGVVDSYLPKKASVEETEKLIDAFLATQTFTAKQVGQATGMFIKAQGGAVDPGIVAPIMKRKLGA